MAATNPKFANKVSYSLTYDVRVASSAPPLSITSPSHNEVLKSSVEDGNSPCISASKEGEQSYIADIFLVLQTTFYISISRASYVLRARQHVWTAVLRTSAPVSRMRDDAMFIWPSSACVLA